MKHWYLQLFLIATLMVGCNPFAARQEKTQQQLKKADAASYKINQDYKAEIRDIKPYQVYRYQSKLTDPFRAKAFIVADSVPKPITETQIIIDEPSQCLPPECIPPEQHTATFLENYSLNALSLVGTLGNNHEVALIKTPDYGVVQVKTGEYMGKNYGKVIAINRSAIILQEKFFKNGLWENKKTILVIRR